MPKLISYLFSSLLKLLCLCFLLSSSAFAEPKKLLIINSQNGDPYEPARNAMLQELENQGYKQGDNLEVKQYYIHNKTGLALRVLRYESEQHHDVIFINGTIASKVAYEFGYDDPRFKFVFCSVTDPVGLGLIEQFEQTPKGNFTGISYGVAVEQRLRLLLEIMPEVKTLGMIYADMPQSHSYVGWLKQALKQPEFSHLNIIFRKVPFVYGERGHIRMARLIEDDVKELAPQVDVFLTPSDQLGTKKEYAQVVSRLTKKPLMAVSEKEIKHGWGAQFGIYAQQQRSGQVAGQMVARLLNGENIKLIHPQQPQGVFGINRYFSERAGIQYSEQLKKKAEANLFDTHLLSTTTP